MCSLLQASEKKNRWVSGNYMFFRMHRISDIYFVGGFGTVQWVDVGDYVAANPDQIVRSQSHQTLQVLTLCTLPLCRHILRLHRAPLTIQDALVELLLVCRC